MPAASRRIEAQRTEACFASSLAAALLDGLFEHPAGAFLPCPRHASPLHSRRSRNEVGMGPGPLKTILGLSRLVVLLLGPEALDQSDQRPTVFGISREVGSIFGFSVSWTTDHQQHSPKILTHRQWPMRRFDVGQTILQLDGFLQRTDRVVVSLPPRSNLTCQHPFGNLEEYPLDLFFRL